MLSFSCAAKPDAIRGRGAVGRGQKVFPFPLPNSSHRLQSHLDQLHVQRTAGADAIRDGGTVGEGKLLLFPPAQPATTHHHVWPYCWWAVQQEQTRSEGVGAVGEERRKLLLPPPIQPVTTCNHICHAQPSIEAGWHLGAIPKGQPSMTP